MRIAVRGPLFAGKTTLAETLERDHGFHLISYTDVLKAYAASSLSALGVPTSVHDIKADKEKYRAFLQELGTLTGFDTGEPIPGIVASLPEGDIVWDNVRFLSQWQKLAPHGFTLVQLHITPLQQELRAAEKGMPPSELGRKMAHPAEIGFPTQFGEIILGAYGRSPEELADTLLRSVGDSRQRVA